MAHIPDGVLSLPVLAGGTAVAVAGIALGLRALDEREIPRTGILAAAFFVASLVAVPIGPTSVHPLLSGLMGLLLGWRAMPAVFVGLLMQAALFGFGGVTTLGVNTVTIALPGVAAAALVRGRLTRDHAGLSALLAGFAAFAAVIGTAGLVTLALALSSSDYVPALPVVAATFLPLAAAESVLTASVVGFLLRTRPELFAASGPAGRLA